VGVVGLVRVGVGVVVLVVGGGWVGVWTAL